MRRRARFCVFLFEKRRLWDSSPQDPLYFCGWKGGKCWLAGRSLRTSPPPRASFLQHPSPYGTGTLSRCIYVHLLVCGILCRQLVCLGERGDTYPIAWRCYFPAYIHIAAAAQSTPAWVPRGLKRYLSVPRPPIPAGCAAPTHSSYGPAILTDLLFITPLCKADSPPLFPPVPPGLPPFLLYPPHSPFDPLKSWHRDVVCF